MEKSLHTDTPPTLASSPDDVFERFRTLRSTGDVRLRDELILEHQWIAAQCARRFRYRGEPEADLVQVAWLGLVKATDRFDPERRVPFHAYAIPTIIGELKRHFRDTTWAVGVPRSSKDLLPRLREAIETLHHRLGRSPSPDEVAGELGVDREAVLAALEARDANRTTSMSTLTNEPSTFAASTTIGTEDDPLTRAETRLAAIEAIEHLDERSRTILVWRFYEELTQREIGERLGIGQVHVSRLLRIALDRMRARSVDADGGGPEF